MAGRRDLNFPTLDAVMADVDRLLEGHSTIGNWTLAQMCNHLATTLRLGLEPNEKVRKMPWIVRRTAGPFILGRVLKKGRMPDGIKAPKAVVPKPGLDARAEAEALRATIRMCAELEPHFEHPFFGRITREQFLRLQCIHSAHHLSYALPHSEA